MNGESQTTPAPATTDSSVIFFGSGPVAAHSLELLAKHTVVEAVITKPRAEHHRGSVPVLELAEQLQLPTFTPANKSELSQLFSDPSAKQHLKSSVGVVIDYGIIINQDVIDYFPLGIVNSHFSLLPHWRGADPITFSVLSGQAETGVSLMLIVAALDEGPLLAQQALPISPTTATPELTEALILLSDELLQRHLPDYMAGKLTAQPQEIASILSDKTPSYSRKLTKEDGVVDWRKSATVIEREIRAYAGWPKSTAQLDGKSVIIITAHLSTPDTAPTSPSSEPGQVYATPDKKLAVTTGDGLLIIDELKPVGKQQMTSQAYLAGRGQSIQKLL